MKEPSAREAAPHVSDGTSRSGGIKHLLLATHNTGKVREFAALLAPLSINVISASEMKIPEPEETGQTFAENALLKARAAHLATGLPALSDDSGLCVHALGGAPGIYSARWTGPEKNYEAAFARIEQELAEAGAKPPFTAHFACVLALVLPNEDSTSESAMSCESTPHVICSRQITEANTNSTEHIFEGQVHGTLTFPPRGPQGFGYDPIFIPDGYAHSFGELGADIKKTISHRARACEKLLRFLSGY